MTLRQNLDINQGETFSFVYTHKDSSGSPVDLTSYSARMSAKLDLFSDNTIFLSTGADARDGTITLGGIAGTVTLNMTAAQSDSIFGNSGFINAFINPQFRHDLDQRVIDLMYDLELVSAAGVVTRAIEGFVAYTRSVTS